MFRGNFRKRSRSRARNRSRNRAAPYPPVERPCQPSNEDKAPPKDVEAPVTSEAVVQLQPPVVEENKLPTLATPQKATLIDIEDMPHNASFLKTALESTPLKAPPLAPEQDIPEMHFLCQLAHGSKTGTISEIDDVSDLYQKIADCFDGVNLDDILFLTVGTYKAEMDRVMHGNVNFGDIIFAHLKGKKYEVEVHKADNMLGLTIADNGIGKCYIKRIREKSIASKAQEAIKVGMHIEKINDVNCVGMRHFEVARVLRDIPVGETFKLRLIEPLTSGFSMLQPRGATASASNKPIENGGKTLRFKATGAAVVQVEEERVTAGPSKEVIDAVNKIFEDYLGFSDEDLSRTVCEIAADCKNPHELAEKVKQSDVAVFGIPDELIYDMYGLYSDINSGRAIRPSVNH